MSGSQIDAGVPTRTERSPVRHSAWFYSVLNAADYFRAAFGLDGTPPDPRMATAIEAIRAQRQPDGTWLQARRHPGRVWFEVDLPAGEPSKWLTLLGTRVLEWWDAAHVAGAVTP